LALVSILLALPAAADAKNVRFKASVSGTQTDTWTEGDESFKGGCTYTSTTSGGSSFKIKTTKPAVVAYPGSGIGKKVGLSVTSSGNLSSVETLDPGQNAATCPPPAGVVENCPVTTKKSSFSARFQTGANIFSAGRIRPAPLLKPECPTLGGFSTFGGTYGILRRTFLPAKLLKADKLVFKRKASDKRVIPGIGTIKSVFQLKATLTRVD
jgi:hypothetical protein